MKSLHHRRTLLAALAGTAVGLPAGRTASAAPAVAGAKVRWPEVTLLDGTSWGPAQAEGKAVVAVFWSTTCPFCRRHNTHVEALHRAIADRPLALITIAREPEADEVRRTLQRQGWSFPVTLQNAAMASALSGRKSVPLTVTVGRQGRLLQVIPGEMFEEDVLDLLKLAT